MNPRPFALALLALPLTLGCGGAPSSNTAFFGLDLVVDKAVTDQLGAFQIVVLPNGKQYDCTEVQKTCLRQQVKPSDPLVLSDGKGFEGRALHFPVNLSGTGTTSQDVSIEVPVGRDYALVIEALSNDAPPRFLGSSCNYLPEVSASQNNPVIAAPMTLTPVDCNPTF
ncbi:MAG: hypothetical protein ACJ8AT_10290 [Hyalangium sp.]|uniref:hypothetical protein n=1 Tax=Hyalangium sp. TaxID=2028555 RepID=UPI00389AAEE4